MRCAAALALAVSLLAQDPRFDVQSRLVLVPVTITDAKGRSIDGLEAPDFVILDNGRPQKVGVDTFATGVAPIALVIAVQSSGISVPALEKVKKIGAMIQPLITGERGCAALVAFAERVQWLQDCTNDHDALTRAFQGLRSGETKSAHMLDAASEAIERLRKRPNVRRVLFLISESRDRGSETDLDLVVMAAQTAGVTVYAATYSAFKTAFTTKSSQADTPPESREPRPNRTEPLSPQGRVPIPPAEQRVDILGGIGELARLGKTNTTQVLISKTGGTTFPFTRPKRTGRRDRKTRRRTAHPVRSQLYAGGSGPGLSSSRSARRPPRRLPHPREAGVLVGSAVKLRTRTDAIEVHPFSMSNISHQLCLNVGQVGNLRPIVNRPPGGGKQPPRRMPSCPTFFITMALSAA